MVIVNWLTFYWNCNILLLRDAFKKIAEKETLVHTGWRGGKRNPLFIAYQKGDIFLWGEGSKTFCHMSHVQFCVSVSSQFVAVFDALHYENFLYHIIKELTWTYPDLDSFLIDKARSTSLYWTKLTVYWFILVSILISSCTMLTG